MTQITRIFTDNLNKNIRVDAANNSST